MLKYLILSALIAGCYANWRHHKHHRGWEDDDEDAVKPPNCDCSDQHKNSSEHEDIWKWKHEDWIIKNIQPGETIDSLRKRWDEKKKVCGTDGVTYANKCEFTNKAASDKSLGKRCRGPCPCSDKEDELEEHRRHHGEFGFHHERAYCLNNGTTVYGKKQLKAAKAENATVGKRCKGECSECADDLKCPRRRHHRMESNVTAPNCVCSQRSSAHFKKFLNSTCGEKYLEKKQICGNDNVTYANKCDFKNKQASQPSLGKRCRGPCPCDLEKEHGHHKGMFHHRFPRHSGYWKYVRESKPYCLSNGKTVLGKDAKKEALRKDETVGVRCKGKCEECSSAAIKCPFDWVKYKEEKEKARPHPPNCTCPKSLFLFGRRHKHTVCGNDNKTYANICELINNQTTDPKLGFRCLGKCPCNNTLIDESTQEQPEEVETTEEPSLDTTDDEQLTANATSGNATDALNPRSASASGSASISSQSSSSSNQTDKDDRDDGENENENEGREKRHAMWGFQRRHHRHHRRHHHRRHRQLCLTNGQTVRGWREVSKAFKADSSVGIRCKGDCDDCFNNTKCPRFPSPAKQAEIRKHREAKMKRMHEWYMEKTMESPNSPPNCTCTLPHHKQFHHAKSGKRAFGVCGTNNVTFADWCEFINNQSANAGLGFRCWGACPCPADKFETSELDQNEEDQPKHNMSFCLTNGKTVTSHKDKLVALAADPTLGVRCFNDCSICQNNLKCPRVFKPRNESDSESHHKFWKHHRDEKEDNESDNEQDEEKPRHHFRRHGENQWEKRIEEWKEKKEQPSFEFGRAFDFGYENHHKGWGHKGWGHKSWGHHKGRQLGWGQHKGWGRHGEDKEECEY